MMEGKGGKAKRVERVEKGGWRNSLLAPDYSLLAPDYSLLTTDH
jgi:hypothetical protein